ncbi:trimeric intracellular cation channel family protein [Myroides odoratimimus]|uniref:trimeric intracellular cation channel family protein n=1 Tax=Myroides odoratimimus TaxID=76832 RepID=UPI00103AD1A2|nr:trimeric intracellular cation channel family protein [Myroides odoratimimus]MDM1495651.1 trimeric intracellular cation channel family protein [Myroides odoratimimus]MDM1527866.1 trimeric intracellular cation channel family protein [Myroides odoratimimus]QBK75872.1 trimeric intracellular cation channel family protein [Myroides odoratimimus]WHT74586.1 trimeric intracellular cation channel family protein [Myroides odoratimimus]WHU39168.1 trimeric intracellular cation channel family protein [My
MLDKFIDFWTTIHFVDIIEFFGTCAFAISGIRMASAKSLDWFGALVVGFVTATGGGTLRDLLLGVTPFWMLNSVYVWCTVLALFFVVVFRKQLVHLNNTFLWFDSIGLGLFVVVGTEKTMSLGYPFWVVVIMATITGVVGGIVRDIMINEIPAIFKQEWYALTCIFGVMIYYLLDYFSVGIIFSQIFCAASVFVIRLIANRYKLGLPTLKSEE